MTRLSIHTKDLSLDTYLSFYTNFSIHASQQTQTIGTATHCNTLQHTATHCNTLQRNGADAMVIVYILHHSRYKLFVYTMQRTATHCNALQHTATQRC